MELAHAVAAFTALSQETRLKVFKILIEYGQSGTAAGTISHRLNIPHNTLSFHLAHLKQAGLLTVRKQGRSMIYAANVAAIAALITYLHENCCTLEAGYATDCSTNAGAEINSCNEDTAARQPCCSAKTTTHSGCC